MNMSATENILPLIVIVTVIFGLLVVNVTLFCCLKERSTGRTISTESDASAVHLNTTAGQDLENRVLAVEGTRRIFVENAQSAGPDTRPAAEAGEISFNPDRALLRRRLECVVSLRGEKRQGTSNELINQLVYVQSHRQQCGRVAFRTTYNCKPGAKPRIVASDPDDILLIFSEPVSSCGFANFESNGCDKVETTADSPECERTSCPHHEEAMKTAVAQCHLCKDAELYCDAGEPPPTCGICLIDYQVGDIVAWSFHESCHHAFHARCITDWIETTLQSGGGRKATCPACRQEFMHRG